ncbi:MAG: ATPase domain-containing protein, partial [Victivallaceae bacterium]
MHDNNQRQLYIKLDDPLDLFFKMEKASFFSNAKQNESGGIDLPRNGSPGTGNIVIIGNTGSGKSTLAMQLAKKCCENRHKFAAYVSLELSPEEVLCKADSLGWMDFFLPYSYVGKTLMDELKNAKDNTSAPYPFLCPRNNKKPESRDVNCDHYLSKSAGAKCKTCNLPVQNRKCRDYTIRAEIENDEICGKIATCSHRPRCEKDLCNFPVLGKHAQRFVLMPLLSPQPFERNSEKGNDGLFEQRFKELDKLLTAAQEARNRPDSEFDLCMVCVDSLNVLGRQTLTRDQLHALFDLFRRRETIGVFVVEQDDAKAAAS